MPGARSADQTVTSFSLPSNLLTALNRACVSEKLNRSQLLREAIAEKLESMGIDLPADITHIPSRIQLNDAPATQPLPKSKPTTYRSKLPRSKKSKPD
jgi:hypothetical protein